MKTLTLGIETVTKKLFQKCNSNAFPFKTVGFILKNIENIRKCYFFSSANPLAGSLKKT